MGDGKETSYFWGYRDGIEFADRVHRVCTSQKTVTISSGFVFDTGYLRVGREEFGNGDGHGLVFKLKLAAAATRRLAELTESVLRLERVFGRVEFQYSRYEKEKPSDWIVIDEYYRFQFTIEPRDWTAQWSYRDSFTLMANRYNKSIPRI